MDEQGRAFALFLEAVNKHNEGDYDNAIDLLHQAIEASKGTDDLDLLQKIYNLTGLLYEMKATFHAGQGEEIVMTQRAMEALQRERQIHRIKQDKEAEAATIFEICRLIERITPNSEQLEKNYQEAAALAQDIDNKDLLCISLRRMGEFYMVRGRKLRSELEMLGASEESLSLIDNQFTQAIAKYQEAYDIASTHLFKDHIGFLVGDLANAYFEKGAYNQAMELFLERFRIAEEEKDRSAMRRVYSALGNIHRIVGKNEEALKYYRLALAIATELDDKKAMARHFLSLGELRIEEADWEDGTMYVLRSIEICQQWRNLEGEAQAYRILAEMHSVRLEFSKAAYCLAVYRKLSKKLCRQDQVSYAHEQLYQLKANRLEVNDGRLVLDSTEDPRPYRITLSTSLTSINEDSASHTLSPAATQSLGAYTPSSSQSGARDLRQEDFFDILDKVASWKMNDQRIELKMAEKVPEKRRPSLLRATSSILKYSLEAPKNFIRDFSLVGSKKTKAVLPPEEANEKQLPLLDFSAINRSPKDNFIA